MQKMILGLLFILFGVTPAQAQNLMLSGTCPGPIDNRMMGMTANSPVMVMESRFAGSGTLTTGPCAGTVTNLATPAGISGGLSNAGGFLMTTTVTPPYKCGNWRQAIDLTTCAVTPPRRTPDIIDDDGDGFPIPFDCDDTDPSINPAAVDIPLDGIDQDCDGWDSGALSTFTGIQNNLPESDLAGWTECYRDYFGDSGTPMTAIKAACASSQLIVACRETGSTTLTVAAQGAFEDVFFETGTGNVGHEANGVEWYYDDSYSWGYVEPGDGMSRNSCDTESGSYPERRLCFHTGSASINGGYRCGSTTGLNSSNSWERVVYSANGVDADGDGFDEFTDCNDGDSTIYPGAPEVFSDGIDQNCDGVDENDADGDGWSDVGGDCDDANSAVNPGATEIYSDGIDNDCDGLAPNDDDGDGWTDLDGDCDDADSSIYPGAKDIPLDGIDQDCNGWDAGEMSVFTGIQNNLPESDLAGWTECYRDYFGDSGTPMTDIKAACASSQLIVACRETGSTTLTVAAQGAFDDVFFETGTGNVGHEANGVEWYYDDSYSWGYVEPGDGMSRNSCDTESGSYPERRLCFHTGSASINGGYRCGSTTGLNSSNSWERVVYAANGADADGDGFDEFTDCNDGDSTIYPGAPEVFSDGIDQNCDGVDENDADGDGWSDVGGDCDDANSAVNPGATEIYSDGIDNDCDGLAPNDDDGDGWTDLDGDCDESDSSIYPGAKDIPLDGIDQDCNGWDAGEMSVFTGIQNNLPESDLAGWTECYRDYFGDSGTLMTDIKAACAGTDLIVACKETGSSILTVAAQGAFDDVFFETGTGNVGHEANGVEWYYDDSYSWGYVEPGDGMSRNSCDTESGSYPERRLCFHTGSASINGGYRCGSTTGLNSSNSWERVVYAASGVVEPEPAGDCATHPQWMPVTCDIDSWVWSDDRGYVTVEDAESAHSLWSGCTHSGDGNDDGQCSLDGTGYVSTTSYTMSGCDTDWYHLGGSYSGNCGGHDGDTVRLLSMDPNGCYDY